MLAAVTGAGDHVRRNRAAWGGWRRIRGPVLRMWAEPEPAWGMLMVPDKEGLPATARTVRPFFGLHRFEWPDEPVEFHLGHGGMIRLLRGRGLEVQDPIELWPEAGAVTRYPFVTLEWTRQWPHKEAWKACKTG
jgi:hypothetical protein